MNIIMTFIFGLLGGIGVMGLLSIRSYEKGVIDGINSGFKAGYNEGVLDATIGKLERMASPDYWKGDKPE